MIIRQQKSKQVLTIVLFNSLLNCGLKKNLRFFSELNKSSCLCLPLKCQAEAERYVNKLQLLYFFQIHAQIHALTRTHIHTHSLSHTHIHRLSLSLTHSNTHTQTHVHQTSTQKNAFKAFIVTNFPLLSLSLSLFHPFSTYFYPNSEHT